MNIFKKQANPIIGTIVLVTALIVSISALTVNILISSPAGLSNRATSLITSKTYYVDPAGNDTATGLSAQTAWKTIAKVNTIMANLQPGDKVLFKTGSKWREQLQITKSGTSTKPITFNSYGTGAKPIISGADLINGVETPTRDQAILLNNVNYVTVSGLNVDSAGINTGSAGAGILAYNTNYVVINNVVASNNFGYGGIYFLSNASGKGQNNIITNCIVYNTKGTATSIASGNNGVGIFLYSPDGTGYLTGNQISNNKIYENGQTGLLLQNGSSNNITDNEVYNNADGGISIAGSVSSNNKIQLNKVYKNTQYFDDRCGINLYRVGSNNSVTRNMVHDEYDTFTNKDGHNVIKDPTDGGAVLGSCGIRFDGGSNGVTNTTGNIISYNIAYNEVDGVQIYNYSNVKVLNNVIYNSTRFGIMLGGKSGTSYNANNWAKNNIIHTLVTGAQTSSGYQKLLELLSSVNNVVDYNIYYPNGSLTTGQDAHSKLSDPLFTDMANHNFIPESASPAINAGTRVSLTKDFAGSSVPKGLTVDIGAYEVQ